MIRSRLIQIPIYGCKVKIVFTDDVVKYGSSVGFDFNIECGAFTKNDFNPIVCFNVEADFGDICHEAFHVTDEILGNRGLPLVAGSEEAYAYLIGYLTQAIYDFQLVVINDILK